MPSVEHATNINLIGSFSALAGTGDIVALIVRPSKTIVFTDSGKAYDINYDEKYIGFYNASMTKLFDDAIIVHEIKIANGGVEYLATS